jgi:hypothetical protein
MPRTCRACAHPNRKAIDAALATGELLRKLSEKYRISISALHRHKTHAGQAIVKVAEKRQESIGEWIMSRLQNLYERAEKISKEAELSGDGRLALAGMKEVRETLAGVFTVASKSAEARAGGNGNLHTLSDEELHARLERLSGEQGYVKVEAKALPA